MTVLFSKQCEYGILSVLYIATKGNNAVVSSQEISERLDIPKEFVSKILQSLCKGRIIGSVKGKNGGFFLKRNPRRIHLIDIVRAIDGDDILNSCVLGFRECSSANPCPVHNKWKNIRKSISEMLISENFDRLKIKMSEKIR
jgi:Rrf2 family protein